MGAALVAAQAAGEGGGEQAGEAAQRLARAGRACGAALRDVLDALGADGTLGVVEEATALQATSGVRTGPAVKGAM
eukprot:173338-Pleurochrysis_carterae.AAC.1